MPSDRPDGLQVLWAPWRMDFIRSAKPAECIFCQKPAEANDAANLLLYRGTECFVLMNLYPYTNGHLMVAPYRHVAMLPDLTASERAEMMDLTSLCVEVLQASVYPDGLNCGMNLGRAAGAGIDQHLHMHVVPRWVGDVNFMSTISSSKVIVQHLGETYAELKPEFDRRRR
ncbi:MAG TPA: HIT domain-containing protein [Armatimonadota bacterium]|nr:HIT domain-containing protein [Armatimonadota bacterium]HQK92280.1 HIT domain-containing protein [Armatimonadota bacterium]